MMPDNYANGLDMHPMRDAITDALHAGQTPREVSSWCEPPVSHQTVWKFKKLWIEPLQKEITEAIEKFAAEHGHLPLLCEDDDITEAELKSDEWLRAIWEFKEKRVKPALELARRKAALELLRSNGYYG
jgi:hypothetical protein